MFFLLLGLLKHHISFSVGIHVLQQIDSGLVFLAPRRFTSLPLLCVFRSHQAFNHSLVGSLVLLALVVVLLQFNNFPLAGLFLHFFQSFQSRFPFKGLLQHDLIPCLLGILSEFSDVPFLGIVLDEFEVAFSVQ